jgi:glutathione synthase/RimK-type ligase-like ATP-grasp enzyme
MLEGCGKPSEPLDPIDGTDNQPASKPIKWMIQQWREALVAAQPQRLIFKLILPHKHGYVAQADFLEQRLVDCPMARKIVDFYTPSKECDHIDLFHISGFDAITRYTVGIVQGTSHLDAWAGLESLERELHSRLSFPWLLDHPVDRQTLVLVGGCPNLQSYKGIYQAANGLGVDIIVLNEQGHWLQNESMSNLRKDLWPVDMTIDSGLPERISRNVAAYAGRVDGLLTVYDIYVIATARAAEILGLPTESVDAYSIARDKFRTRQMTEDAAGSMKISNIHQVKDKLKYQVTNPTYPLIVKPTDGYSSECVFRVSNESDLLFAVDRALSRYGGDVIVEPYVDGPEVDANFVLCDGEILFFEISDDLPSDGDRSDASVLDNFAEHGMVYPSALPDDEITAIKSSLYSILLDMGFKTGAFHLEARMKNSSMEYENTNGVVDLSARNNAHRGNSRCFVLEVNARAPGFYTTFASKRTYGVDFFAQGVLAALGDHRRMRVLSQPFRTGVGRGAQYWCQVLFITPTRGGICKKDSCEELQQRCPELMQHVPVYEMLFPVGDEIPSQESGRLKFLAYFIIVSRQSRSQVVQIARDIRENFRSPLGENET